MQRFFISIVILFFIVLSSACRKDFSTRPGNADFEIEKDTLLLDSVFTNISSHTYRFKIYNTSNADITLNKVYLQHGSQSHYRLNVDGDTGKVFDDVLIHANDSIFVFVEVTADINQLTNPVYEEKLYVEDNAKKDSILLSAFVKDADFYYPQRFPDGSKETLTLYTDPNTGETTEVEGFFLNGDVTFTHDKPVVVYGYMGVPRGHTLTIEEGTHLYFHFGSGLIVWEGAHLQVNGSLGHEVIFEDDRMEPDFDNHPGLWSGITLRQNSEQNAINYAIIKNAEIGIVSQFTNTTASVLDIRNTQIYNCSLVGIFGLASNITGENLVMNNFGMSAINLQLGGVYDFKHCTFANFSGGVRNEKSGAVYVNNYFKTEDNLYVADLQQFNISNSIVYGNSAVEFFLDKDPNADFHYQVSHSLIKFNSNRFDDVQEVDFADASHYQSVLLNQAPKFWETSENQMIIDDDSPAINLGDTNTASQVPLDIAGNDRTISPDLGAYQHQTKPD